jgi:outer membrane protein assembly factor BamB
MNRSAEPAGFSARWLLPLALLLSAGCDSLTGSEGTPVTVDGGTVTLRGGDVVLAVPRNAVSQTVVLSARRADEGRSTRVVVGTAVEILPADFPFRGNVVLTLRYDPTRIRAGLEETGLQLYERAGDGWRVVRGSRVDRATHTVSGTVRRTGTYAVANTRPEDLSLLGSRVGGALYVGEAVDFGATVRDLAGDTLHGFRVVWTTSDASRAKVDVNGRLLGVAPGEVVVRAAAEDLAGTTTLRVLPRPAPTWTPAHEWSTYQGNPARTGYVAATLDPQVFRVLWSRRVAARPLNPPALGDDRVFVSLRSLAGQLQLLLALDVGGGQTLWEHDFGQIQSVHPPAYGDGRVFLTTGGHQDSFLYGFDAASGVQRFRSQYANQWSRWLAPAVVEGAVYMAGGYQIGVFRFDAVDGSQRWFAPVGGFTEWTPALQGDRVLAYTGGDAPGLTVIDRSSGEVRFLIRDPRFRWRGITIDGAPAIGDGGLVFVTQGDRLLAFDPADRTIRWTRDGAFAGTPALSGGLVYVINGTSVEARRQVDGVRVWSWAAPSGAARGAPVVTDNLLFVSVTDSDPWDESWSNPRTYALDRASGRHVWVHPGGGHLALGAGGVLLVAAFTGDLTAIAVR